MSSTESVTTESKARAGLLACAREIRFLMRVLYSSLSPGIILDLDICPQNSNPGHCISRGGVTYALGHYAPLLSVGR